MDRFLNLNQNFNIEDFDLGESQNPIPKPVLLLEEEQGF